MNMLQQISEITDLAKKRELEDLAINALLKDYDRAEAKGQTSYMKYLRSQMRKLGIDDDYLEVDAGDYYELKTNE